MISKENIKLLLMSALLFSTPAQALIVLQQASVPVNVDYDSNLNLLEDEVGVWRYTTVPNYSLSAIDEKNKWFSNLSMTLQRSSNKDVSDYREDPALRVGWQRELEKGSFSLSAGYEKRSSRFTQFNTNALTDVDGTSVSKSLAASYTYALTQRLNVTLGADYSTVAFTDSSFVDSTTKSVNGSITYELNEKLSPFVRVSFTDFQPNGSSSQTSLLNQVNTFNQASKSRNLLIGSTVLISPKWTFSPSIGVNSISSSDNTTSLTGGSSSNSGSGWIADTNLSYIGEKSSFQAVLARSVAPGGLGDFQKTDTLGLNYSYILSEKSSWGANFNISKSQSQFDSETAQLNGFYSRDLALNWQMRLIAGHRSLKQNNFSASNNNVGISLIYNIPEF